MKPPGNLPESIRTRLHNRSRERGDDFQVTLTRYAIERVLYRLGRSVHGERFVLKGAALYSVWEQETTDLRYRATRDLDLWGSGLSSVEDIVQTFREVLAVPVEPDGLVFPLEALRGDLQREGERYEGVRLTLQAMLGTARIPLHIDFGFGDAITPAAVNSFYPVLLPTLSAPQIRIYPRETVVAEKFEALVSLGIANTRLKDFYDLWMLSEHFDFVGQTLAAAIEATFARRETVLPIDTPVALTPAFTQTMDKATAWRSFGKRSRLGALPDLEEVAHQLQEFLLPVVESVREKRRFDLYWRPLVGWTRVS